MEKINKQRKEYLNWDQYFMGVSIDLSERYRQEPVAFFYSKYEVKSCVKICAFPVRTVY